MVIVVLSHFVIYAQDRIITVIITAKEYSVAKLVIHYNTL